MTELYILTRTLEVLFKADVAEEHVGLELQSITFVADLPGGTRVTAVYWDDFQSFMQRAANQEGS